MAHICVVYMRVCVCTVSARCRLSRAVQLLKIKETHTVERMLAIGSDARLLPCHLYLPYFAIVKRSGHTHTSIVWGIFRGLLLLGCAICFASFNTLAEIIAL